MADSTQTSESAERRFEQHLVVGGELLRTSRIGDARKEFEAALALQPNDLKALGLLGLACFRQADFDSALTVYQQLVERQPSDASLRLNLGLVHLKLGRPDAAIDQLTRARELDPSMQKAVGYLGLAHARRGEYLQAFESFLRAGQLELADEMRPHLADGEAEAVEARLQGPGPAAPGVDGADGGEVETRDGIPIGAARDDMSAEVMVQMPDDAGEAQPVAVAEPTEEPEEIDVSQVEEIPEPEPAETSSTGVSETSVESDSTEVSETPVELHSGVPVAPMASAVSIAVEAAAPSPAAEAGAQRTATGHQPPVALTEFATSRLIRPDDGDHPFEISAGGVLIVRVRGRVYSRTEGVIVSGGELAYEPATRRVRGTRTETPFGGDRPLFIVTGDGHLVASPLGHTFAAIRLDEDVLYVREDLVFSFEEQLRWENGHVPGSEAGINVVQFRGRGCVAIRTRKPSLGVKLASDKVLYVDADMLAGWVGRVVPRVVAPAAGGETSALFVECTGEGVVLLEDQDPPELGDEV